MTGSSGPARRLARCVAAVVAAVAVAACGIDAQERAQPINPDILGGLDQTVPPASDAGGPATVPPSSQAPASTLGAGTMPRTMYFIEGPALVPVGVEMPPDPSLRGLLSRLEKGPTREALDAGIRSAVPEGLIASTRVAGPRVTVDFDPAVLQTVDGRDRPLLIGQVVMTLAAHGMERVRFTLDGEPLQVPRRDGTLTDGTEWVTAWDYEELVADDVEDTDDQ